MKKHLIVRFDKSWVNIPCDSMEKDDHFVYGYKDGQLVALLMQGIFDAAWISEEK